MWMRQGFKSLECYPLRRPELLCLCFYWSWFYFGGGFILAHKLSTFHICIEELFSWRSLFLQHTLEGVKSKKVMFEAFRVLLALFINSSPWWQSALTLSVNKDRSQDLCRIWIWWGQGRGKFLCESITVSQRMFTVPHLRLLGSSCGPG